MQHEKPKKIKEVTTAAIEQLIAALNEGRSETLKAYLRAIGRFHRYSPRNVMLIASQDPLLGVLERANVFSPGHIP